MPRREPGIVRIRQGNGEMLPNKPHGLGRLTRELRDLLRLHAPTVMAPAGINRIALLAALGMIESTGGRRRVFVFEPAYAGRPPRKGAKPGFYYKRAEHVRKAWRRWGDESAGSRGSFHLLHTTATEMGFGLSRPPWELVEDAISMPFVIRLLNRRIFRHGRTGGASSVEHVLDSWNTGTWRDKNVPASYIAKGMAVYRSFIRELP